MSTSLEAKRIRVVLDNLSTHTVAALYAGFPPAQARRVLSGLSSTTRPSTPAGSTWLRSRSACSKANVSIAASKAATGSLPRSTSGSLSETKAGSNSTSVLHRQGQNQNGACLSRSLAQRLIISVQGSSLLPLRFFLHPPEELGLLKCVVERIVCVMK